MSALSLSACTEFLKLNCDFLLASMADRVLSPIPFKAELGGEGEI